MLIAIRRNIFFVLCCCLRQVNRLKNTHKKSLNKVTEENKNLKADVDQAEEQNVALNKQKDTLEDKLAKLKKVNDGELFGWRRKVEEVRPSASVVSTSLWKESA